MRPRAASGNTDVRPDGLRCAVILRGSTILILNGSARPGPEPWSHSGELIIATVLEGILEFRFEDHATALHAGDTISYSPADPHSWGNPSDDTRAVALFFGMPAEF